MLLVKLVCMVACLFGCYYVSWGYQLLLECFEFLVIELVLLILYVCEYCQLRNDETVMKRKPVWPVNAKEIDRMKVMAAFEEDLSDDG